MKKNCSVHRAFTLVELLIIIATITILFSFLLPAMAKSRVKSTGAGCLNNLRQMMVGWSAYKDDNNDTLLPNAPLGPPNFNTTWCGGLGQNWTSAPANTNRAYYLNSLLAPYIANRIELYRCPADVIPSENGQRLRSYSMNGQMGVMQGGPFNYNPGWRVYTKGSDLTRPVPKDAFIFADESMSSMNDGYLQIRLTLPQFPDLPANYHEGGGTFSFADGHVELRRWTPGYALISIPYKYGMTGNAVPTSTTDPDWHWLTNRTSSKP